MRRGPRKLRVVADGAGLTQFGGVALIRQYFQRLGLRGALWRQIRFAQRNHRYSISESLEALLDPLVLGLGRIETTEPRATLPRLRQRLFLVPAQLVRPGGVPTLRIAPSYAFAPDFLETLRRIRCLRPPF